MQSRRRFIAALAAGATGPALAQFRIEVQGAGGSQLPIAIAPFRDDDRVAAIVRADLQRSGQFRIVDARAGIDERAAPAYADWRGGGGDAFVAGSVAKLGDGRYDVRYKLWDTVKASELLGQSKVVPEADLRLAAHRIADEIHEKLTGERGVYATRIAYVVKNGRRYTLHVTDADGEGGQVALASPEPIISPAWAPDGRTLAYVSFETQKAVVWVQDLTTGERRQLAAFRGSNSAPAFSPDGRELCLTLSRDGPSQLYVIPRSGGSARRLTSSNAIDTEPVYAPDGATVYFVSDRGGGPQVYRTAAAGGAAAQRVTFSGDYNISPAVSPDGRRLAYITRSGGAFRLMLQELDGGGAIPLSDTADDESPSFSPNGRLIVYASRQGGRDVLMTTTLDGKIKTRLVTSGADMREPAWGPWTR